MTRSGKAFPMAGTDPSVEPLSTTIVVKFEYEERRRSAEIEGILLAVPVQMMIVTHGTGPFQA
jgi:hypothetical protein